MFELSYLTVRRGKLLKYAQLPARYLSFSNTLRIACT